MVTFFVESSSRYTPIIGSNSINFNQSKYAAVRSNEKYTGSVTVSYNVQITMGSDQYRMRPTALNYVGLGEFGFFANYDLVMKFYYSGLYHNNIGTSFTVVENYNTTNNTYSFIISNSNHEILGNVSGTLNADEIQVKFACGDDWGNNGCYAAPTVISNIYVSGSSINKERSFGIII